MKAAPLISAAQLNHLPSSSLRAPAAGVNMPGNNGVQQQNRSPEFSAIGSFMLSTANLTMRSGAGPLFENVSVKQHANGLSMDCSSSSPGILTSA